ncbi:glycosyltransferase [Desulfobacterota bacterium M19]
MISQKKQKRIWIAWERQRRSVELAASLGCKLYILEHQGCLRYFKCLIATLHIVKQNRPAILFVQNPSMILACFASCFLKYLFRIPIVVDRHTNFFLTRDHRITLREVIFHFLSYLSIRSADLTIVTNKELSHVVRVLGGVPFVLTDKIPNFNINKVTKHKLNPKGLSIFFITSFAKDEPFNEVFKASRRLAEQNIVFYVSGNFAKQGNDIINNTPNCVNLTGFLSDEDFASMLFSADIVMVLTTAEYTLLCGCYEAVAAQKPLITTSTEVLRKVFPGAVFVTNNADSIVEGILEISKSLNDYTNKTNRMKDQIKKNWNEAKIELDELLAKLEVVR